MAILLDGKEAAKKVRTGLRPRIAALKEKGVAPKLAVVLVGEDPASQIYVRNKEKMCLRVGMESEVWRLPADISQDELIAGVGRLNADPSVHGILVQSPVPKPIDEDAVTCAIRPEKDVDCFHPFNIGRLMQGKPVFLPCTPRGVMELLRQYRIPISGKSAVVVGRSNIVGKPMAQLLLGENATVTMAHSRTRDLPSVARQADILVAAVGRAGLITAEMVKPGAVVIDVGINRVGERVVGDVDFASVQAVASAITPVPGGVGVMTVAMLMLNTVEAAERAARV